MCQLPVWLQITGQLLTTKPFIVDNSSVIGNKLFGCEQQLSNQMYCCKQQLFIGNKTFGCDQKVRY